MSVQSIVESGLREENIEYCAYLPFDECKIINNKLINNFQPRSVIIFLAPYYTGIHPDRNVSLYAVPRDYHLFFKKIFLSVENKLLQVYPNNKFKGFADHSPINEVDAATKAGLGIIGEILTDVENPPALRAPPFNKGCKKTCENCGKCRIVCPSPDECLSAITQKRGTLTDKEQQMIHDGGIAWGCDVCQLVCPHNAEVAETPIQFFREDLIPNVPLDCEIEGRAYAWRGKGCIHRNLELVKI